MLHEKTLRRQYDDIFTTLTNAFPGVQPVESRWILLWLDKYPFSDVMNAIQTLHGHPLKARFNQQSIGKAISALLRESAMRRLASSLSAPKDPQEPGGQS
jgi:hypothetical protein